MSEWVIITGGGAGMGGALAHEMSKLGYKVLAVDLQFEQLDEFVKTKSERENIVQIKGDLTSDDTLLQIAKAIPESDRIVFLIQCAVVVLIDKFAEVKREELERSFSVNVVAPFLLIQKLLPRLDRSKARILHIDTLVDHFPDVGFLSYGVTKAAHYKMGQQMKLELADTAIKVGTLYPSTVKGFSWNNTMETLRRIGAYSEKLEEFLEKASQMGTLLQPKDVAKFMKFVLLETSDEEFVSVNWRADDEKYWGKWKK